MKNFKFLVVIALFALTATTVFAQEPDPSVPASDTPWWISLVTAAVTAIIGLFSRWFEKKFLERKVTKNLTRIIRDKDPSVDPGLISRAVSNAFAKHSQNGTSL